MSPTEEEAIRRVVEGLMRPRGHPFLGRKMPTIEGMIMRWLLAVEEVEQGYEGNVDDYINDLSNRERIEEIIDALDDTPRDAVRALVDAIDVRFLKVTCEDPTRVIRKFTQYGHGSW